MEWGVSTVDSGVRLILGAMAVLGFVAFSAWVLGERGPVSGPSEGDLYAEGSSGALLDTYNPVREGEETPDGFRQVLRRDQIPPVYNPRFKSATDTNWENETLVIGVALDGEAKAYPVNFLNYREMVIDWIGGTPILVTW